MLKWLDLLFSETIITFLSHSETSYKTYEPIESNLFINKLVERHTAFLIKFFQNEIDSASTKNYPNFRFLLSIRMFEYFRTDFHQKFRVLCNQDIKFKIIHRICSGSIKLSLQVIHIPSLESTTLKISFVKFRIFNSAYVFCNLLIQIGPEI